MIVHDWGKLTILVASMLAGVVLMVTHTVEPAIAIGMVTGPVGYVMGNGRLAIRQKAGSPMLAPKYLPEDPGQPTPDVLATPEIAAAAVATVVAPAPSPSPTTLAPTT